MMIWCHRSRLRDAVPFVAAHLVHEVSGGVSVRFPLPQAPYGEVAFEQLREDVIDPLVCVAELAGAGAV